MTRAWKASVTVAAVVERDGRFLMVEEDTDDGVRINQPAGHLEPGESLVAAVARETLEETAHVFVPTALLGVYMTRSDTLDVTYVRFAFVGELGSFDSALPLDAAIRRTLWLTLDELRGRNDHRSPLVLRCIEDYLAGQRFPLNLVYSHPSVVRDG